METPPTSVDIPPIINTIVGCINYIGTTMMETSHNICVTTTNIDICTGDIRPVPPVPTIVRDVTRIALIVDDSAWMYINIVRSNPMPGAV